MKHQCQREEVKEVHFKLCCARWSSFDFPLSSSVPHNRTFNTMALQERLRARKGRTSLPMIFLVLIALLATPNQLSKCLFVSAANDDQAANDDANANGGNNAGGDDDDAAANNENDDGAFQGDDKFQWDDSRGYDEVSVMPVSCVN
jgi:hypothetical protein